MPIPAFLLALFTGGSAVVAKLAAIGLSIASLGAGVVSFAYGLKILLSISFVFFAVIPAVLVIQGQLYSIWVSSEAPAFIDYTIIVIIKVVDGLTFLFSFSYIFFPVTTIAISTGLFIYVLFWTFRIIYRWLLNPLFKVAGLV